MYNRGRVNERRCPQFRQIPIKKDGNKRVLESLETIQSLSKILWEKKKGEEFLVDARPLESLGIAQYPTAVNIPYNILNPKSKYRREVLKLIRVPSFKASKKRGWVNLLKERKT